MKHNVLETKIKQSQRCQTSHYFFASFHILLPSVFPCSLRLTWITTMSSTAGQSSRGVAKPASAAWPVHPSALHKAFVLHALTNSCTQSARERESALGWPLPWHSCLGTPAALTGEEMCALFPLESVGVEGPSLTSSEGRNSPFDIQVWFASPSLRFFTAVLTIWINNYFYDLFSHKCSNLKILSKHS